VFLELKVFLFNQLLNWYSNFLMKSVASWLYKIYLDFPSFIWAAQPIFGLHLTNINNNEHLCEYLITWWLLLALIVPLSFHDTLDNLIYQGNFWSSTWWEVIFPSPCPLSTAFPLSRMDFFRSADRNSYMEWNRNYKLMQIMNHK